MIYFSLPYASLEIIKFWKVYFGKELPFFLMKKKKDWAL